MKKKFISLIIAVSLIPAAFISGCSGKKDDTSRSSGGKGGTSGTSDVSEISRESIDTKTSSAGLPLKLNEWGKAAKFCTADSAYKDVPIRILSVRRGAEVNDEVRQLVRNSSFLIYSEPDDKEEYAIAEYEISLDGFPVKEGGVQADITASVSGADGGMIKLDDGSYFGTAAASLVGDDEYYHEGVVKGKLAYKIIKGYSDYLLVVGETGETQAYFRPE